MEQKATNQQNIIKNVFPGSLQVINEQTQTSVCT